MQTIIEPTETEKKTFLAALHSCQSHTDITRLKRGYQMFTLVEPDGSHWDLKYGSTVLFHNWKHTVNFSPYYKRKLISQTKGHFGLR